MKMSANFIHLCTQLRTQTKLQDVLAFLQVQSPACIDKDVLIGCTDDISNVSKTKTCNKIKTSENDCGAGGDGSGGGMNCGKEDCTSKSTGHHSKNPGHLNSLSMELGNSDESSSKTSKRKIKPSGYRYGGDADEDKIDYGERGLRNRITGQTSMGSYLQCSNAGPGPGSEDSILQELQLLFVEMSQVGVQRAAGLDYLTVEGGARLQVMQIVFMKCYSPGCQYLAE
jgi:hypothetical protein